MKVKTLTPVDLDPRSLDFSMRSMRESGAYDAMDTDAQVEIEKILDWLKESEWE